MPRIGRHRIVQLIALLVMAPNPVWAAASVWSSAPKPKFPAAALNKGSEGYVIVRSFIGEDGTVTRAIIARSSGDTALDEAARTAVLKWKMSPAAIKPAYKTKGYDQRIDFRQEVPIAVRYRDRSAYFGDFQSARIWTHAPFPEYPYHERSLWTQGLALVRIRIGRDGRATSTELVRSSGNANLDKAALAALSSWRAHKEYADWRIVVPVRFKMRPYR